MCERLDACHIYVNSTFSLTTQTVPDSCKGLQAYMGFAHALRKHYVHMKANYSRLQSSHGREGNAVDTAT